MSDCISMAGAEDAETRLSVARIRTPAHCGNVCFDSTSRAAEQYRLIRTKILQHRDRPRVIAVSSPGVGDGKTTTAVNLARALALKESITVALLDADLRRAGLAKHFEFGGGFGLADVLAGGYDAKSALYTVQAAPNLSVMSAGHTPDNPSELLESQRWRSLCISLRECFSFIVLDTPPVGLVADYDLIAAQADGVVLVVRPDHTPRALCDKALAAVPSQKLIGVVINSAPDWFLGRQTGYGYKYGYGSD